MENIFWDPVDRKITQDSFVDDRQPIAEELRNYKANHNNLRLNIFILSMIAAGPLIFLIFILISGDLNKYLFYLCFLCFLPIIFYIKITNRLQDKLILFLLCEKNKWVYKPEGSESINKFITAYHQVFDKGRDQYFQDQIWGSLLDKEEIKFWTGTFCYIVGSGKSQQTYEHPVFMLKLKDKMQTNFFLDATNSSKSKVNIKTESNEFNDRFKIICEIDDASFKNQILKILSPSVQVRLVDFGNTYPVARIYFQKDVMILEFVKKIWNRKYTNFYKEVQIDHRDEESYCLAIKKMFSIPSEMIQFIQ